MTHEELKGHVGALKDEIGRTEVGEAQARDALRTLDDHLQDVLEHPGDVPFAHHRELMDKLTDALAHFEVSHPNLTALMNNVVNSLNALGI